MERKKKILVIEDNKRLLSNLKTFLESTGFIIETATDGENGIVKAKEMKPDLIICDISIPVKDGYEVLNELLKNKRTKRIPFIFLTAKVEREDFRKGMLLGADDYIFKPFDLDDLLKSINIRLSKAEYTNGALGDNGNGEEDRYGMEQKVLVKFGKKMEFCAIKEIKYIKSHSPYVLLKINNRKSSLVREPIGKWEYKLPQNYFIRIHKSVIVNKEFVSKVEKIGKASYILRMKEEPEPFIISRRCSKKLKEQLLENL